jgi:glycosyltransferase involved in cell wall biosynthesis
MRIVFDSQIFCAQTFGGISRYFASLAREMAAMTDVQPRIVAPVHINEYAAALPRELVIGRKIAHPGKAKVLLGMASSAAGALIQYGLRPDIVHETYFYPQPFRKRRTPTVVSVFDMGYQRFPDLFQANSSVPRWMKNAVQRADHIICISEYTRRDMLDLYDIPADRVSVIYLGYDPLVPLPAEEGAAAVKALFEGADRPYMLYVGGRAGCKNFPALLGAFASSAWLKQNFALVCFGGGPFTAVEQTLLAEARLEDSVRQVSGPDRLLASYYRHAAVFVYPSVYEGFGIPPLEAMSLDCPVVCSNASSIPEVVGDAAVTFDPMHSDAIRGALEDVLSSVSVRARLTELGRRRKDLFSWSRCARETLQIYRDTVHE